MSDIQNNKGSISGALSKIGSVNGGMVTPKSQVQGGNVARNTGGTRDYNALYNQPSINEHILIGDSDFEDIGLHFMTNTEIRDLLGGN